MGLINCVLKKITATYVDREPLSISDVENYYRQRVRYYGLKEFYYEFFELSLCKKYEKRAKNISAKAENSRAMLLELEGLMDYI